MRTDFKIAILLALAAIPVGVALMAAPEYLSVLKEYPAPFFWGGLALAAGLITAAIIIAVRGESSEPMIGHRRRMIALICMVIFGVGFLGSAAVYFWPRSNILPRAIVSEPPPAPAPLSSPPALSSAGSLVLIEPPQSARKNQDGSQRIFIRVLPQEMAANFEGRTANQAMSLVAPYLLKWIAISGVVNNAKTYGDGTTSVYFAPNPLLPNQITVIVAEFEEQWKDALSVINNGDKLRVVCRIAKIERWQVNMDSCELIE